MNQIKNNHAFIQSLMDQMVDIPGGSIDLRDDRTKRKWSVDIEPFLISRFPVTQDVYYAVMKENPGTFSGEAAGVTRTGDVWPPTEGAAIRLLKWMTWVSGSPGLMGNNTG